MSTPLRTRGGDSGKFPLQEVDTAGEESANGVDKRVCKVQGSCCCPVIVPLLANDWHVVKLNDGWTPAAPMVQVHCWQHSHQPKEVPLRIDIWQRGEKSSFIREERPPSLAILVHHTSKESLHSSFPKTVNRPEQKFDQVITAPPVVTSALRTVRTSRV